jgi:hypothetical protein
MRHSTIARWMMGSFFQWRHNVLHGALILPQSRAPLANLGFTKKHQSAVTAPFGPHRSKKSVQIRVHPWFEHSPHSLRAPCVLCVEKLKYCPEIAPHMRKNT